MLRNRLNIFRHKMLMNQKQFAEFLGVNQSLYNRWEKHDKEPNIESYWNIAKRLGCKIDDLIEEIPE